MESTHENTIVAIGAATRDVFLTSDDFTVISSHDFSTGHGTCVTLGGKIPVNSCTLSSGGGATNAATTFSRWGIPTSLVTLLGDDAVGREVLQELREEGITTEHIQKIPSAQTAYSTILTTPSGERSVLIFRGKNLAWKSSHIPDLKNTRGVYLTSLGGSEEAHERICEEVEQGNLPFGWNPGNDELKNAALMERVLPHVTFFLCNKEEAQMLLKQEGDSKDLCKEIFSRYRCITVVTDGPLGSYATDGIRNYHLPTTPNIPTRSRTGAGDAFGSGCFAGILSQKDLSLAMILGTCNAENVIQYVGAKTGILRAWPKPSQYHHLQESIVSW